MNGPGIENPKLQPRVLIPSLIFLFALFAALWVRRPAPQGGDAVSGAVGTAQDLVKLSGDTMGTTWSATVVGAEHPQRTADAVQAALDDVNETMSTWLDESEISRLNRAPAQEAQATSDDLLHVLGVAAAVSEQSGGAFDVTVGPLVDAWGFGPEVQDAQPSAEVLDAARARVGWQQLALDGDAGTVTKARTDVEADLSAVAKGHGVDQATAALAALGHADALVEVGGEVRVLGHRLDGTPWRAGIERPDGSRFVEEVVPLGTGPGEWPALATSGDYRRYREVDGQRISHTIDPRTGRPIDHRLASVSVLAQSCAEADAWATALNVLGPEEGMALAESLGLPTLMIVRADEGFETRTSSDWPPADAP